MFVNHFTIHRVRRWIKSGSILVLGCVINLFPLPVIGDEYLESLRDEAGELEYLDEARAELKKSETSEKRLKGISPETKHALQNIASFESILKEVYPASAVLYFKLDTGRRLRVFKRFKVTRKFSVAKRMILEMRRQ